jgi:hypothetical protein
LPVEETDAEILESEILLVDTVAVVKIALPFKVAAPLNTVTPLTINPLENVPKPELETVNRLVPPVFKVKAVNPVLTEALTAPVAILDKFNPVIPEAGIPVRPAPEPENKVAVKLPETPTEPVNNAGPMFMNVLDPETVNDPVIVTSPEKVEDPVTVIEPETSRKGVTKKPELAATVPLSPCGPWGPTGPEGPGAVTTTTLLFVAVVTLLIILLLL